MAIQNLDEQSYDKFKAQRGKVVVKFYADWCGDCQAIKEPYIELAQEIKDKVSFGEVNNDEQDSLSKQEGIKSIPTFILFSDGKEIERFSEPTNDFMREKIMQLASQ